MKDTPSVPEDWGRLVPTTTIAEPVPAPAVTSRVHSTVDAVSASMTIAACVLLRIDTNASGAVSHGVQTKPVRSSSSQSSVRVSSDESTIKTRRGAVGTTNAPAEGWWR
ncbi:MAG: hypothetical protein AAF266_01035 [Planctomycetota bacterium]